MAAVPEGSVVRASSKDAVPVDAFHMDKTEVTQEQYLKVMGENPSYFKGKNLPVEKVNWHEADAYCRKLGKRLPTEWEWELAARAGSDTTFYWGDSLQEADAHGWHKKNASKKTHPVGEKQPNAFGLHDMAGNVWEWTASDHENGGKVQRGGSWRNSAFSMRSSHRILSNPIYRYHYVGFRCAR
ncbi:MAG: SUMF1/EgtB/PvdO family nonheme iron enzyme [Nitrospinaceae bacterium]|nr:SUMF1/EgtB/PvdO family nonheme iron enzyme [Nitrospinaceae bacterium]